jgi:hypothetical protein
MNSMARVTTAMAATKPDSSTPHAAAPIVTVRT